MELAHILNLCFIFGNARSGKSFMMNRLVGTSSLFKVINSSVPCTRGVDMSSYVASAQSLYERAVTHRKTSPAAAPTATAAPVAPGEAPAPVQATAADLKLEAPGAGAPDVGFVDVEGQGAEDGTYDTILALPLLLVSKVVLFNHKGAPTVSDMLSKLGVLARAADCVDLGKGAKAALAGGGGAAGGSKQKDSDDEDEDEEDGADSKSSPADVRGLCLFLC